MTQRFISYSTPEKLNQLQKYSNPNSVLRQAKSKGYDSQSIFLSPRKDKKYMIITPENKRVHFGAMGYQDFTKHKDQKRRQNYLSRSGGIQGKWKNDKYSPNSLARTLLW